MDNQNNQPTVNNTNNEPTMEPKMTPAQPSVQPTVEQNTQPATPTENAEPINTQEVPQGNPSTPSAEKVQVEVVEKPNDGNVMSRAEMAGIEKKEDKGYGKSIEELERESEERRAQKKAEFIKKANEEYKPNSKFKSFMLFVFFAALIAFIIFLPQIQSFISTHSGGGAKEASKIVTGKLVCELKTNTENLNIEYKSIFSMTDNKLYGLEHSVSTKGDRNLDAETLDGLNEKCEKLKDATADINGISVSCKYDNTTITQTEDFTYSELEADKLDAAFAEAGGTYSGFDEGQDMDAIEKEMKANGYTCNRKES